MNRPTSGMDYVPPVKRSEMTPIGRRSVQRPQRVRSVAVIDSRSTILWTLKLIGEVRVQVAQETHPLDCTVKRKPGRRSARPRIMNGAIQRAVWQNPRRPGHDRRHNDRRHSGCVPGGNRDPVPRLTRAFHARQPVDAHGKRGDESEPRVPDGALDPAHPAPRDSAAVNAACPLRS